MGFFCYKCGKKVQGQPNNHGCTQKKYGKKANSMIYDRTGGKSHRMPPSARGLVCFEFRDTGKCSKKNCAYSHRICFDFEERIERSYLCDTCGYNPCLCGSYEESVEESYEESEEESVEELTSLCEIIFSFTGMRCNDCFKCRKISVAEGACMFCGCVIKKENCLCDTCKDGGCMSISQQCEQFIWSGTRCNDCIECRRMLNIGSCIFCGCIIENENCLCDTCKDGGCKQLSRLSPSSRRIIIRKGFCI